MKEPAFMERFFTPKDNYPVSLFPKGMGGKSDFRRPSPDNTPKTSEKKTLYPPGSSQNGILG
jgi:hypothetical protein